ncbi:hypothetical protein GCM10027418_24260 [Mariniluteicoccus endophyticus]
MIQLPLLLLEALVEAAIALIRALVRATKPGPERHAKVFMAVLSTLERASLVGAWSIHRGADGLTDEHIEALGEVFTNFIDAHPEDFETAVEGFVANEVHAIAAEYFQKTALENGHLVWEWQASQGGCGKCAERDGQRYSMEHPFKIRHFGCKCAPVIIKRQGEIAND